MPTESRPTETRIIRARPGRSRPARSRTPSADSTANDDTTRVSTVDNAVPTGGGGPRERADTTVITEFVPGHTVGSVAHARHGVYDNDRVEESTQPPAAHATGSDTTVVTRDPVADLLEPVTGPAAEPVGGTGTNRGPLLDWRSWWSWRPRRKAPASRDDPAGTRSADVPVVDGHPVARPVTAGLASHDLTSPDRSRAVATVMAAGVLLVAVSYALGRRGHPDVGTALLWPGMITVFVAGVARLLRTDTSRRERLRVSVLLGVGLYFCFELTQIAAVREFDELLHLRTLLDLQATGGVFTPHPGLPVSPRFPGLELLTNAVVQLLGVPNQVAVIGVVLLARVLLVYGLFLLIERLSRSAYAAGVGVAIYSCSPQFFFFNAQFAYQTLAIALTVLLLLVVVDRARYGRVTTGVLVVMTWVALALTHHITSWIAVGLLAGWTLCAFARRDRADGRVLARVTLVGLVATVGWALVNISMLRDYLGPILSESFHQAGSVASGETKSRKMFTDSAGTPTPTWQIVALLGTTLLWSVSIVPLGPFRFRPQTDGRQATLYRLLRLMHLAFPLSMAGTVTPRTAELSARLSTFVYLGIAAVLGLTVASYLATRRATRQAFLRRLTGSFAIFVFIGGTVLGSGADWSRMPGPYLVIADGRSIDPYVVAATRWANTELPAGSRIAGDRETGTWLMSIGRQWLVTGLASGASAGPLYFSTTLGDYERAVIAVGRIQYVIVDTRLADGLPHETFYTENGEAPMGTRLTAAMLAKFDTQRGSVKVYDNGPVKIYDVTALGAAAPAAAAAASPAPQATAPRATPAAPQPAGGTR
ncbi:glycosyltransferase family 39 protein [Protofrankia coriariae]|uniref:glycosyltransferase family 39 protein n=1 Tax=Protofrankia coriariae TaxID=1562887 RepID=UPI00069BFB65|nr:glycosyltransferase family 39 protein [Protofrankia coriariae]